jgi:hypothetical protein
LAASGGVASNTLFTGMMTKIVHGQSARISAAPNTRAQFPVRQAASKPSTIETSARLGCMVWPRA